MSVLTKNEIRKLIDEKSMISDYINLERQLQPNGIDLTLDSILIPDGKGYVSPMEKVIPKYSNIKHVDGCIYNLDYGMYLFNINETINLPSNICAITIQRSSLMRSGVNTNIGFWDSGYLGKGYSTINVMNPHGFSIQKESSIIQMIFLKNTIPTELYNGSYHGEGVKK